MRQFNDISVFEYASLICLMALQMRYFATYLESITLLCFNIDHCGILGMTLN